MPIDPKFPSDPFAIISPDHRWHPARDAGGMILAEADPRFGSLLPPLADKIRRGVAKWRESGYAGASATSRGLLEWWFQRPHIGADGEEFRYYFAQREAVESAIWLHDVERVRDGLGLARYDSFGEIRTGELSEDWPRFVVKMATGSGKTKVMSLLAAWSYFHKHYEEGSGLARNILLIAPNIIVLDRLRRDFEGLRIFHSDPVLPEDGHAGRNWRADFHMRVHRQDEVRGAGAVGNLFLTNIHRVFMSGIPGLAANKDERERILGPRPVAATTDSGIDLGEIVREVDELLVINDEAHHIHNEEMAWAKNIGDIHGRMVQRERRLSLQLDFTATPKHDSGRIFAQTISDYPLAEAIHQKVVKRPVIPDKESADRLVEGPAATYSKRYADHIRLGVEEWRKARKELARNKNKPLLFVMTEDTKTCDDVARHLEAEFPDLRGKVLVIHTKNNGEISEKGKARDLEELRKLREQANSIDNADSPYLAVVSVLMLREGWDVRNVTTIVGLRPYESKSKILPEQTLGRGLRLMFPDDAEDGAEKLSVIGTDAFMDFVREVEKEGVELEAVSMGGRNHPPQTPMIVAVDRGNPEKDIAALDIEIPRLSPRLVRDYERIAGLDPAKFQHAKIQARQFSPEESREFVFRDILTREISHRTNLDGGAGMEESQLTGYFAQMAMRRLGLFSGYDFVCEKMREFLREHFFTEPANLTDENILRNLAKPEVGRVALDSFCRGVNAAVFSERDNLEARGVIRVSAATSFAVRWRASIEPRKSVFNRIVGDFSLELRFAKFLDRCPDIASFAKNYFAVGFRLEYVRADGELSNYHPDFLVKLPDGKVYVVETKGREDVDAARKFARLSRWCEDVNAQGGAEFHPLYVPESGFDKSAPKTFAELIALFANAKPHSA